MKNSSTLFFYNKLDEIQKTLIAHDVRVNERFDRLDAQLKLLLQDAPKHVSKELEEQIKKVSRGARAIDQKVTDQP